MSKLSCPICKAEVVAFKNLYKCINNTYPPSGDSCKFVLFDDCLSKLGKNSFEEDELQILLNGGQVELNLINKTGKGFSCNGVLEDRGKYHSVKFVFEDSKQQVPSKSELDNDAIF